MSKTDEALDKGAGKRGNRLGLRFWSVIIALPIVAAIGGLAGYWYFFLRGHATVENERMAEPELPLPFYLEIKPFVVSVSNNAGSPHFVQLGLNLGVPGSGASNLVTAMLPEIQDAVRQTALAFKVEDIVTPAGVDKLREAMIANTNQALVRRLGAEKIKRFSGAEPNSGIIQNIFFTTLVVE